MVQEEYFAADNTGNGNVTISDYDYVHDWLLKGPKYIDGIRIPSAYKPGEEGEIPVVLKNNVRYFRRIYTFLFYEDQEYRDFMSKCLQDSRKLSKALDKAFGERDIPFYSTRKKTSRYKNLIKFTILIRPPFFSSKEDIDNTTNRLAPRKNEMLYSMHIDEDHNIDSFRFFGNIITNNDYAGIFYVQYVEMVNFLNDNKKLITANYGNWDALAAIIADKLKKICDESIYKLKGFAI